MSTESYVGSLSRHRSHFGFSVSLDILIVGIRENACVHIALPRPRAGAPVTRDSRPKSRASSGVTALRGQGLDPGAWQLAVFIAEELSQSTPEGEQTLLPVFLSPNDVRAAFNKNGLQEKALERVNVLELRQLLRSMLEPTPDAVNPWRAVQFVASREAIALAQDIAANAK